MINIKKYRVLYIFLFVGILAFFSFVLLIRPQKKQEPYLSPYPDGKIFAFTITDDAHGQTVQKIKPIYDFLYDLGLRTTIAVYVKEPTRNNGIPDFALNTLSEDKRTEYINKNLSLNGDTLQQKDYLDYIKELHQKGFEIAIHTVSAGNDLREATIGGYEEYKTIFGEYPKMNIMHSNNLENVYWGYKVFTSGITRWIFENVIGIFYSKARYPFQGEDSGSPYFWGDILKGKTKYVRMWGTHDINTLRFNPSMPYHDPQKPYVNYWYSFSEGHAGHVLNKLLSDKNIEKLRKEKGASIVYTHFSSAVIKSGDGSYQLNPYTKKQLTKLAQQKNGWFIPASELLDRLLLMKNVVLFDTESAVIVSNLNSSVVSGVTVVVKPNSSFYDEKRYRIRPNEEGEIVIGDVPAHGSIALYKTEDNLFIRDTNLTWRENVNLVLNRIFVWLTTVLDL